MTTLTGSVSISLFTSTVCLRPEYVVSVADVILYGVMSAFFSKRDSSFGQVVWRQLHLHPIPRDDAYVVLSHEPVQMAGQRVAIVKLH